MAELTGLFMPLGVLLWLGWNFAVLSSIQLTVRLIRAFSIPTTLLGAVALTVGTLAIALIYVLVFGSALAWYPVMMALTGVVGFVVAGRVLRIRRLRSRIATAFGTAILSAPWPVFFALLPSWS